MVTVSLVGLEASFPSLFPYSSSVSQSCASEGEVHEDKASAMTGLLLNVELSFYWRI